MNDNIKTIYRSCTLCEAICGLEIKVQDNKVKSIRGDKDDPFSKGFICPKALALKDIQEDPDRLRRPMKRIGSEFVEISWEQAFSEIGNQLAEIRATSGADAIGAYRGNPAAHNWGMRTHTSYLMEHLGSRSLYTVNSMDGLPVLVNCLWLYGTPLSIPVPDLDRTDLLLIFGANPIASNGSAMTAPNMRSRLKAIKKRRGHIVLVDPRRNETAVFADEHISIRPGTDALMMLAMLNVIKSEGRVNLGRLEHFVNGLDVIWDEVLPFTPERVEDVTGVAASTIRELALRLASTKRAVVYGRIGICVQEFGALATWCQHMLNIVTGHLDKEGCAMFPSPAIPRDFGPARPSFGETTSRVSKMPCFNGELPLAVLAEEIATSGEGQLKAMIFIAGNVVLSAPNGPLLEELIPTLDCVIAVDIYLNETARLANYVLPPTSALEHDHYNILFHALNIRNGQKYSPAVLSKPVDSHDDWEILGRIVQAVFEAEGREAPPLPSPEDIVSKAIAAGPFSQQSGHRLALTFDKIKQSQHGIDLGAMVPQIPEMLRTASGKIECANPAILADFQRASLTLDQRPTRDKLVLIGRRHMRSNNSWMHNVRRLSKGKNQCVLYMHPDDVRDRSLSDGEMVKVSSRVGSIHVPVRTTEDIMRGVVCMPHGYGHDRTGTRLQFASAEVSGASINDITDQTRFDPVIGTSALNGTPVEVSRE